MRSTRTLTAMVLLAASLAAAASAPSALLGCLGLEGEEGRKAEANATPDLQQLTAAVCVRSGGKIALTERLLHGELTLFEAAAWFRFLNESGPNPDDYRRVFPGDSDEEKVCRQVIQWARALSPASDPEAECLVGQLEEELRRQLEEYGRVVLPSADALPEPR